MFAGQYYRDELLIVCSFEGHSGVNGRKRSADCESDLIDIEELQAGHHLGCGGDLDGDDRVELRWRRIGGDAESTIDADRNDRSDCPEYSRKPPSLAQQLHHIYCACMLRRHRNWLGCWSVGRRCLGYGRVVVDWRERVHAHLSAERHVDDELQLFTW